MDTIRNRVRELREDRGLSQSELARLTGVTRQTIISPEKGLYELPGNDDRFPMTFSLHASA